VLQLTVEGLTLEGRSERTVNGHPALVREMTVPVPDGRVRQLHVGVVVAGAFYSFVGTALDDLEFVAATRCVPLGHRRRGLQPLTTAVGN